MGVPRWVAGMSLGEAETGSGSSTVAPWVTAWFLSGWLEKIKTSHGFWKTQEQTQSSTPWKGYWSGSHISWLCESFPGRVAMINWLVLLAKVTGKSYYLHGKIYGFRLRCSLKSTHWHEGRQSPGWTHPQGWTVLQVNGDSPGWNCVFYHGNSGICFSPK